MTDTARFNRRVAVTLLFTGVPLVLACARAGELVGQESAASKSNARSDRLVRFTDGELMNMLMPRGAVPYGMSVGQPYLLPNDLVAELLSDQRAARLAMEKYGRVQGAAVDYDLTPTRRATEPAVAIASSVAWYTTAAGAETVLADPTMALALHGLRLRTGEIKAETVGQQSRTFRGFRDGDSPDLAAYVVLFRRSNLVAAVVVVVPASTDDGGRLATKLARQQALIPMPVAR